MTAPPPPDRESLHRNLDAQHRHLTDAEAAVDRLLAGDYSTATPVPLDPRVRKYTELSAANDATRLEQGWDTVDLDAALTGEQRRAFENWQDRRRTPWGHDDLVAVGLAGALGLVATWFDATLDTAVRDGLGKLKNTDLLRRWEKDARGMPTDYMGPGFGGRAHRVRSAGHDLGRPVAALRQIMTGTFTGTRVVNGVRYTVEAGGYKPVTDLSEALALWAKHLAADLITDMSLPLPGWTLLYDLGGRRLRTFAHHAYLGGESGAGLNLRSGAITPALSMLSTEVIVRTHVHTRALAETGTPVLSPSQAALRTELLLAGHSLVGAASLGKVTARAMLANQGPLALRHLNVPVLLRAGVLATHALRDSHVRSTSGALAWGELLASSVQPWQLDTAATVEAATARS